MYAASNSVINFNTQYADPVKLLHTRDLVDTLYWRVFPSASQQAAVQQLNPQGLYPTGNARTDFGGGAYPATIVMEPTGAPGCEKYYCSGARGCGSCSPNMCCPGQEPTPWDEILDRGSCSRCDSWGEAELAAAPVPGKCGRRAFGRMQTISRAESLHMAPYWPREF